MAPFISRPGMKISPEPSSSMANPKFLPSLTRVQGRALSLRPDRTVKKTPSVWQTTASRTSSSSASITLRSAARSPPNLAFRSLTVQGCIWMARSILSLIGIQVNSPSHPSAHRLLLRAGATSQPGASPYGPDTKTAPRCCGAFSACRHLHAPGGHSPCLAFSCGYGSILLRLAGFSGAPRRALVKTGARLRVAVAQISGAGRSPLANLDGGPCSASAVSATGSASATQPEPPPCFVRRTRSAVCSLAVPCIFGASRMMLENADRGA